MNGSDDTITKEPDKFFNVNTFSTLYGGAMVAWVSTNAICHAFQGIDRDMTGLVVALLVALVAFFIEEQRALKNMLVVPFNGLLIYLTIVGGTSFLPEPATAEQASPSPSEAGVPSEVIEPPERSQPAEVSYGFFTKWNPSEKLIRERAELAEQNRELEGENIQLREVNKTYQLKLDSTVNMIQQYDISPQLKQNMLNNLNTGTSVSINPNLMEQ